MWDFKKANSQEQEIVGRYHGLRAKKKRRGTEEGYKVPLQHAFCRTNTV